MKYFQLLLLIFPDADVFPPWCSFTISRLLLYPLAPNLTDLRLIISDFQNTSSLILQAALFSQQQPFTLLLRN